MCLSAKKSLKRKFVKKRQESYQNVILFSLQYKNPSEVLLKSCYCNFLLLFWSYITYFQLNMLSFAYFQFLLPLLTALFASFSNFHSHHLERNFEGHIVYSVHVEWSMFRHSGDLSCKPYS